MLTALIRGSAGLLLLLPATAILVDSWVAQSAFVDPDGEGPQAPFPNPEVVEQRAQGGRAHLEILAPPRPWFEVLVDVPTSEVRAPERIHGTPLRPGAVDPSGWLGRRHLRSPA